MKILKVLFILAGAMLGDWLVGSRHELTEEDWTLDPGDDSDDAGVEVDDVRVN